MINKTSITLFVSLIMITLGSVAVGLTVISTYQFRDSAIESQSKTLSRVIEVAAHENIKAMHEMANDMAREAVKTTEFRQAFKQYVNDQGDDSKKLITQFIDEQFNQRYVNAGFLEVRKIRLYNKELTLLVQSSEGYSGLKKTLPDFLFERAKKRKGAERLKSIGGTWLSKAGPSYSLLAPVGGLRLAGYIEVVLDPTHNLKNIEKMLQAPIRISRNDKDLYTSDGWDEAINAHALIVNYQLLDENKVGNVLKLTALEDVSTLYKSMTNTQLLLISAFVISIIITIFLALLLLKKYLFTPLNHIMGAMTLCAGGDLRADIRQTGLKEIHLLAGGLKSLVTSLREQVSSIQNDSVTLTNSAINLSETTQKTSSAMEKQQIETEQLATAMNEMAATVTEVSKSAVNAAAQADTANAETEQGRNVVDQTITSINNLASDVEDAAEVMKGLEAESDDIGSVVDVIKNIAEQTNLLALNAAIEAARAGEQGRGFAVVADEVRTLANRTQKSTEEINTMIDRLQAGTRNAVSVMTKGKEQAQTSVEQASLAGKALQQIQAAVQLINDMNTQIATAAEEQSAVAQEINRNVISINQATEATYAGTQDTTRSSEELNQMSEHLREISAMFKV